MRTSKTSSIIGQWGFFLYLTTLSMLGFIATDMYLPAFKSIESTLSTTTPLVAMSLTVFLAGLAAGQLLYGKLVEYWGNKRSLQFGLMIFIVATAMIMLADNIVMFNIGRFMQAIGVCSAGVIWQALVIEKYDESQSQSMLSSIMPLVALSPALAPILGAFILNGWGWQAIFACLVLIGLLLMVATQVLVAGKPTVQLDVNPSGNQVNVVTNEVKAKTSGKTGFATMLANPFYLGNVLIFAACSGAFFSYLTLWPAVMGKFGFDATAIGLSFIPQTLMFIVGGYGSKKLINKYGANKTLTILLGLFFSSTAMIAMITLTGMTTIYPLLVVFAVMASANGAIYPIVVNSALQTFKQDAAKAAGLQNFIQISIAFAASSIVALFAHVYEVAIGLGIVASALLVMLAYWIRGLNSWQQLKSDFVMPDPARLAIHNNERRK
ncbi:purine nucleoside transporter PunC [Shewanella maritima]|uniref:purine nucleoside transporter PunC n=1 Tax=Shewanella maritima TaxID=2520507 RepID=UPI0037367E4C